MGGGGRADGSPLLGDLGDAEAGEGIGAGGQGGDGSADPTRCLAEERWTVTGVLADGVTERGNAALGGLESEGHREAGVVAQAGRDRVAGGLLRRQDGQAQNGPLLADQLAHERDSAAGKVLKCSVAFVLGDVEVGLALVDDSYQQRQVGSGATGVPGVPLPTQGGDVPQSPAHLGVLVFEQVEGFGEMVAAVAPGAVVPGVLVAAVLAVQERELGGGGGGELAQPGRDEAGLAVAGQAGDADAGEAPQRQGPGGAAGGPADIQPL